MSTTHDLPAILRRSLQFSIRSLLWLTAVIALLLTCLLQSQRLRQAQQALARTEWATPDVTIPPGKFRLMVNHIVADDDLQVCVIRFESNRECFVSADGQGSITSPMADSGAHWAEIKIVGNYDRMARHLSLLTRVGSSSGYASGKGISVLPPDAKPKDFLMITVEPGLYDLSQPVEIYREDGKPVMLTVK